MIKAAFAYKAIAKNF